MTLNLYLLRHGETTYSRTGAHCGWIDPDLTPEGLKMAESFADVYKNVQWNAVYSSPMKRTLATAEPICKILHIQPEVRIGLKGMGRPNPSRRVRKIS
jgi:broad specificity phosphatase PhoE